MKQLLIFSIVLIFFSSSTCNDEHKIPCIEEYTLLLPINVTAKDTFRLGDTIWVEAIAANKELKFKDKEDKMSIGNWDMTGIEMGITRLDTSSYIRDAMRFFKYVNVIGKIDVKHFSIFSESYLKFDTVGIDQRCKFAVIPTQKGIFSLYFASTARELTGKPTLASDCIDKPFIRYITNNGDYNYYLQQQTVGGLLDSEDVLLYSGSYAFVVIP